MIHARVNRSLVGKILVILSLVPAGFLIYTLVNLETLGITRTHPPGDRGACHLFSAGSGGSFVELEP
jgi:hypothetical protein